jgi:hypothetical protein
MKRQADSVGILIASFPTFLGAFDAYCPFTHYGQLKHHVETIRLRRVLGSAKAAVNDPAFQRSLYRTLEVWGRGSRASRLRDFPELTAALRAEAAAIEDLDGLAIDEPGLDAETVGDRLGRLAQALDIGGDEARIVPGSTALHHLLPDLVVPIDNEHTRRLFQWPRQALRNSPGRCFREAFAAFARIARAADPAQYVGARWYTSRTKVIDNAVVGFSCWVEAVSSN